MPTIGELVKIKGNYFDQGSNIPALLEAYPSLPYSVVMPDLHVGIEIEVERARGFNDRYGVWSYKADGSLRNGGIEWISWPLKGKAIPAALQDFFVGLNKDAHFSPRTSLHFHFDVRHLSLQTLSGIVLVYLAVESLLYKFVGNDREKSIFCVPLFETNLVNDLVGFIGKKLMRYPTENSRYAGLNLDAVKKFGTIEFRHLYGTNDVEVIMTWINLLMSVYKYGSSKSLQSIIEEIKELNTNSLYIGFVNSVFGQLASELDLTDVKSDMEKGVKAVKQSIISNSFFEHISAHLSPTSKGMMMFSKKQKSKHEYRFSNAEAANAWINLVGDGETTMNDVLYEQPPERLAPLRPRGTR